MDQMTGSLVVIAVGILCILGALLNWGIVVGSGKLIPRVLGPVGAKVFMVLLGIGLIGYGIVMLLGLV